MAPDREISAQILKSIFLLQFLNSIFLGKFSENGFDDFVHEIAPCARGALAIRLCLASDTGAIEEPKNIILLCSQGGSSPLEGAGNTADAAAKVAVIEIIESQAALTRPQ